MHRYVGLAASTVLGLVSVACTAAAQRQGSVTIQLLDPRPRLSFELERHLSLTLDNERPDGWELDVRDDRAPASSNLLYHSLQWHGPYPSQIYAWHVARDYFSNDRWLCVHRHHPQYEIHAVIQDAVVAGTPQRPAFSAGTLTVEWWRRRCRHGTA